jgi:hypothetical protein
MGRISSHIGLGCAAIACAAFLTGCGTLPAPFAEAPPSLDGDWIVALMGDVPLSCITVRDGYVTGLDDGCDGVSEGLDGSTAVEFTDDGAGVTYIMVTSSGRPVTISLDLTQSEDGTYSGLQTVESRTGFSLRLPVTLIRDEVPAY